MKVFRRQRVWTLVAAHLMREVPMRDEESVRLAQRCGDMMAKFIERPDLMDGAKRLADRYRRVSDNKQVSKRLRDEAQFVNYCIVFFLSSVVLAHEELEAREASDGSN